MFMETYFVSGVDLRIWGVLVIVSWLNPSLSQQKFWIYHVIGSDINFCFHFVLLCCYGQTWLVLLID